MTKKRAKKVARKVAVKDGYTVSIAVNGTIFTGVGKTIEEAQLAIPAFQPKTKGIITIEKGGKLSKPIILAIPNLKRLFFPGMTGEINRTVLAKRYATLN